jgi:CheY-like chemotaxis protein
MQTAKRVLLVEDDIDDQTFFIHTLERVHPAIECTIAVNGLDALDKISLQPSYDIIFLDLNMPLMDGYEFLKEIKAGGHKNIPVIVLSTSNDTSDIERCKKLGAAMYCRKKNSLDDLFEELKSILSIGINFHAS